MEEDVDALERDMECLVASAGDHDSTCLRNAARAPAIMYGPFSAEYWPSSSFPGLNEVATNTSQPKHRYHNKNTHKQRYH